MNPTTPDGHYFVVIRQLWRCSNPSLSKDVRQRLVNDLMAERREVKAVKTSGEPEQLKAARTRVQAAKVALGKRGPMCWSDDSPDLNRLEI